MRIELHPDADAEFAAQVEYYEREEEGLGLRFYGEVMTSLAWIAKNPSLPSITAELQASEYESIPILRSL